MTTIAAPPQEATAERRDRGRYKPPSLKGSIQRSELNVRDISLTGIAFETTHPIQPKRQYQLELKSPFGVFNVSGRVVWCHLTATVSTPGGDVLPLFRAGMRFDPLRNRDAEALIRLLESEAARNPSGSS